MFVYLIVFFQFYFVTSVFGESMYSENADSSTARPIRYLFYDVNPPEGFNLRRDVYLRMAILSTELQKKGNWVLVLPPWSRLYHWRTHITQDRLSWSHFFDLPSLQKFAPVIEMLDFIDMHPEAVIDQVYVLQHFENMFKTGNFVDKMEIEACTQPLRYTKERSDGKYLGQFWGIKDFSAKRVDCLSFHGHASLISPLLQNSSFTTVMLDHAEVPLHDRYGDVWYWRARRSMRFSRSLRELAEEFREKYLNSSNAEDGTIISEDWTLQKQHRRALGGPYLAVHLRRRDFVHARSAEVPSLPSAVAQIQRALKKLNLDTVFVATDAPEHEIEEIEELAAATGIRLVTFRPAQEQVRKIKDGGVAIVDQIICSFARKFIGTHESTYSLRIQEEREILGFPPETTFNRLCGDGKTSCQQPAQWLIRY